MDPIQSLSITNAGTLSWEQEGEKERGKHCEEQQQRRQGASVAGVDAHLVQGMGLYEFPSAPHFVWCSSNCIAAANAGVLMFACNVKREISLFFAGHDEK